LEQLFSARLFSLLAWRLEQLLLARRLVLRPERRLAWRLV
jgi:hypothetical protein